MKPESKMSLEESGAELLSSWCACVGSASIVGQIVG